MKKTKTMCAARAGAVIFVCLLFLTISTELSAETPQTQGPGYNVAGSFKDNLMAFTGKDVYVSLRSGKTYEGYVKSVGDRFLHLEKIVGKDFFDALIRMDDISAIEARFRGFK
jgi:hypothetical protein